MINLEDEIEVIESGYEFLLAFAAQGRPPQVESGPGPHARTELTAMLGAMKKAADALADSSDDFEQIIFADLKKAIAVMNFVLSQAKIGSEVVDNLNASIHLRTVLTDFFLYSEAFKPIASDPAVATPAWDKIGN